MKPTEMDQVKDELWACTNTAKKKIQDL